MNKTGIIFVLLVIIFIFSGNHKDKVPGHCKAKRVSKPKSDDYGSLCDDVGILSSYCF